MVRAAGGGMPGDREAALTHANTCFEPITDPAATPK